MRKVIGTALALLLALPQGAIAQDHEHGGGEGHPGGGGGGHAGGGGGHPGGGAPHMGGGGGHPGGAGGGHGEGGHSGGPRPGGQSGGHAQGARPAGIDPARGGPGHGPNAAVGDRSFARNGVRGAGASSPRGGHGLPPPPNGNWHRGWYGGRVSSFRPVHAPPFRYPGGYGYRRWGIGLILPSILFGSAYYYSSWSTLGAYPPPPGDRWIRYGPDLLLVNTYTGRVDDAIYGAFY